MDNKDLILKVENLHTSFKVGQESIKIVKGVSLEAYRGKVLAIVGESGCGKSVTVHSIVQLLPKTGQLTEGKVLFYREDKEYELNKLNRYGKEMRSIRGKDIGMIFQDPMTSLNPVYKVGDQVAENIMQHQKINKKEALKKVVELFELLGIPDARTRINDYPHQFSGGMKQRVMIAIAMICNPDLIIADEPTTALDVTIQAQIMDLMRDLKEKENKSIILITHNMGLVAEMADYVSVMYMGRIMESGKIEDIFKNPSHPYTKALLRSVPVLGMKEGDKLETIRGITPRPQDIVEGCEFAGRCDFSSERCLYGEIPNYEVNPGHNVRCVLFDKKEGIRNDL